MFAINGELNEDIEGKVKGPVMESILNVLDNELDFMFLEDAFTDENRFDFPIKDGFGLRSKGTSKRKHEGYFPVAGKVSDDSNSANSADNEGSDEGSVESSIKKYAIVGSQHMEKAVMPSKPAKSKTVKKRGTAMDRRRERNRVLARKTRLRKKFFFESLQMQVTHLANENKNLKCIVKDRISEDVSGQILSECNAEVPAILTTPRIMDCGKVTLNSVDYDLVNIIQAAQRSFVITNPSLPDNPIMFASPGFLELSKYSLHEVIGRNCRFMQGPGTDSKDVKKLREGIIKGEDVSVTILNYKKDGTPFYNQIYVAGLKNTNGEIVNFVGVQVEVQMIKKVTREQSFNEALEQASAMLNNFPHPKRGRPKGKTSRNNAKVPISAENAVITSDQQDLVGLPRSPDDFLSFDSGHPVDLNSGSLGSSNEIHILNENWEHALMEKKQSPIAAAVVQEYEFD